MPQVELNEGGKSPVLILAIDPGTTGAKFAFLKSHELYEGDKFDSIVDSADRIHMLESFPGYCQAYVSTLPTTLIYEAGRLAKWGHEAVNFQRRYVVNPECLVTNWKLKLLEGSRYGSLETTACRLGKPPGSFATDFFGVVAEYLFNDPGSCLLNHFGMGSYSVWQFKFIDVVIAMPPGWTYTEHSVFSNAAKKALAKIPNVRVITVSETECALRSWMSQEGRGLNIADGEVVILLDLGGGTACLSAFYYDSAMGKWVHLESYSLRAGSELVTANFERDFLERFRQTGLPETAKVLYKARQEFDLIKTGVGAYDEPEFWDCPVEGLTQDEGKGFLIGLMRFSSQRLKSYFEPLQDKIMATLDEMTTRICQTRRKPKYCVLAGAYAKNILFLKRFHAANNIRMQMQVFSPQKIGELVARGACLTRVEGDCRLASGSRISVGIMTFLKWAHVKDKCPDAHHFLLDDDKRTVWCRVITWVIKKGDVADPDKAIIDHDGKRLRKRHIEMEDNIIFEETICTSEAHPGENWYTVLMYGTDDCGWRNKQDFKEKYGMPLNIHEFKLDLTDKSIIQQDGSEVAMKRATFKRDHAGRYFEYKYYMNLSQTDCRMSIEAFSANGRTRRMLLQYSISAFEVESAELQDEHRFVEKLSLCAGSNKTFGETLEAGPTAVRTRTRGVRNAERLPSPANVRGLRSNEKGSLSNKELTLAPVTEEGVYQPSRQNNFSAVSLLSNARPLAEKTSECPHEGPLPTTYGVINSRPDLLNVAMATKAVNVAMAAKAGIQKNDQLQENPQSKDQVTPIPKRVRRADLTSGGSGKLSRVIPSGPPRTPGWTSPDFGSPGAESETSDYQPSKNPTKKPYTPSLRDPVTKPNKPSRGVRKNKHRKARPSRVNMSMAFIPLTGEGFE